MSTAPTHRDRFHGSKVDPLKDVLAAMDTALVDQGLQRGERAGFESLSLLLGRLHAGLRTHHAAGVLSNRLGGESVAAPELVDELAKLSEEHTTMLGLIDRLVRAVDAMPDRSPEDREVFLLRARELLAFLRRHEAEEDRLFFLSLWRDTGGES